MKIRPNGFTLIELLVVVAIVAILASLAVPSFSVMLKTRAVRSAALTLINDMRYAQSESLRRSSTVSICSLATNSVNTCSGSANWVNGWMIFWDTGTSGVVDGTDEIVRVQQPFTNIASVEGEIPANDRKILTFQASGRGRPGTINQTFRFTPKGVVPDKSVRIVCVSQQGRVRLLDEGSTSCS